MSEVPDQHASAIVPANVAKPKVTSAPRLSLPAAAAILVLLTHIWPWFLPAIRQDKDIWMALAIGQLSFWPLFAGLIGARVRWPVVSFILGVAVAFGMLWYCRWQFGFAGYGETPSRDIAPFAAFGAIGAVTLLILYVFCIRALRKAEDENAERLVMAVARRGAIAGLAIPLLATLLLGIPWLILAPSWEFFNYGPTYAMVAGLIAIGLAVVGALWGSLIALARNRPPFSWRRTAAFVTVTGAVVGGGASYVSIPLVRHHEACESLAAAGVEVVTWGQFFGDRVQQRLEGLGIVREEPFWVRWHREYVPIVTALRIDGKRVDAAKLAVLGHLRDDNLLVELSNPDPENQILRELAKVPSIGFLNILFPAPEDELLPLGEPLSDEAFSHIAEMKGLISLKLFNARFSAKGLQSLVGKVNLESLHLNFCDAHDDVLNVATMFEKLETLILRQTQITDRGLQSLRRLEHLDRLALNLSFVRGEGLAHVAALPTLTYLDLQGSPIQDDALAHLASAPFLSELDLSATQITGRGLRYLDRCAQLEEIRLDGAALTDAGFMSAAELPWRIKLLLGETRTLSMPGILQMHQERARLNALPDATDVVYDELVHYTLDEQMAADEAETSSDEELSEEELFELATDAPRHGMSEPFAEWLETAGDSKDEEGEALVDAEIELEHNVIILYQYEVADELIEAYRNSVLREPDSVDVEEVADDPDEDSL